MNGTVDYSALDKDTTVRPDTSAKATVVFKPAKRMKKRRQLDALVSNGKLPRRSRTSSGHELLRSNDSESSEVEEFSVLEGQKWGRRFPSSCCTTFAVVILVVIITACVLACATLIWMHLELKRDFNSLRDRLATVENRNAGTLEEFQALQSRLQAINRTVVEKTSGLDLLNKSITDIKRQISSLETQTTQLANSVPDKGGSDVKDKAVASTVASLGSDLQSTQSDLKTFKTTVTSQIDDLTSRITALENPGGREGAASVDSGTVLSLQTQLGQMNTTFLEKFDKAASDSSKLQTHMDLLDQFTTDFQAQMANVTAQVSSLNQSYQLLETAATQKEDGSEASSSMETTDKQRLTDLENKVQAVQAQISQIQSDHSTLNGSQTTASSGQPSTDLISLKADHEAFLTFKADVSNSIQALNGSLLKVEESVSTLNTDMESLYTRVTDTVEQVENITTVVEGVVNFLNKTKQIQGMDLAKPPQDKTESNKQTEDDKDNEAPDFPTPTTKKPDTGAENSERTSTQSPKTGA